MKIRFLKYIFILNLIFSIGCGQDLKTFREVEIEEKGNNKLILNQEVSITINPDSNWIFHIIRFYINNNVELTDSVDFAAEGFNFRLLDLNEKNITLLMIEAIYEYVSYYPVYLIQSDEILKIGNLNIRLDCDSCDVWNYPLNDIIIRGNDHKVEFSFEKDLVLMDMKNFPKMKKNNIRFLYDFENKKLEAKFEN